MTNRRNLSDPCLSIHSSENAPVSLCGARVGGEGVRTYSHTRGISIRIRWALHFWSPSDFRPLRGFISFQAVEDSYRLQNCLNLNVYSLRIFSE
jgi:hypothetical protein